MGFDRARSHLLGVLVLVVFSLLAPRCATLSVAVTADVSQYESRLTLPTSSGGAIQQTAYDDRTDTLYVVTGTTSGNQCGILALPALSSYVNANGQWPWIKTIVNDCLTEPMGVAWASGTAFGRPDTAENDVLFFSTYLTNQIWAYSPALNKTAVVAGSGIPAATDGAGRSASFTRPEGIAFIKTASGAPAVVVADYGNRCVRSVEVRWLPTSAFGMWAPSVSTVAGICGAAAPFSLPRNVAFGSGNHVMYIGDGGVLRAQVGFASAGVSTVTTNGGLSVATIPKIAIGAGGRVLDAVIVVDGLGFVTILYMPAIPDSGQVVPELTVTVLPQLLLSEVRYATVLGTGHVLVATRTDLYTSAVSLADVAYSTPPVPGSGSESTTTTETASEDTETNSTHITPSRSLSITLSASRHSSSVSATSATPTRSYPDSVSGSAVPTRGSATETDDTPSDYTMLWILLGVGVPFALGVGVALGCCVDRCCCEDKAARALAHADTNSGEAAGVVVEMVPVRQSPPTALEVPPTAEPREIARTVPATPATVAGLQTDTRHSAVADQPAPAVGERMATDSEPAARAAFVANVPAATSDVDDLDDACDGDRRAVRGPPCDSFSSAGDAVDCAIADVDPCVLVAEAAPATSSVVAQADEEDAQCGCDGTGPAPAIEEANPAATNVSVDDVASPPTSSAEAAEEGYHDDGGLEDFAVDLADVHLDG